MTGINIAIKVLIFVCVIVISAITSCSGAISDARLCFDPKCSEPVSTATTLMRYQSNDPGILSFESNVDLTVFSKSAGKRQDLWGVEINGKRGYVPMSMIKEKKVLRKKLVHQVPTEQGEMGIDASMESQDVPIVTENVEVVEEVLTEPKPQELVETEEKLVLEPSQVSPSFEVHDGTTIPMTIIEEPLVPSYSTAVPQNEPKVEEHPVLSVHPNIASSMTLKDNAEEIPMGDTIDAGKYMEITGLEKDISTNELGDVLENEMNESIPLDFNFPKKPPAEGISNVQKDSNAKIITNNGGFDSENTGFSSPQELSVINDPASNSEAPVEPKNITNDPADHLSNGSNKNENNLDSKQTEGVQPIQQELDQRDEETSTKRTVREEKENKTLTETPGDIVTEKNAEMPVYENLEHPTTMETFYGQINDDKKVTETPVTSNEQKIPDEPLTNDDQEKTEQPATNDEERMTGKPVANEHNKILEKPVENEEQKLAEQLVENETEKKAENPLEEPVNTEKFEKLQNPETTSQSGVPEPPEPEKIPVEQTISLQNEMKTEHESPTNENARLDDLESSSPEVETWTEASQVEKEAPTEGQLPVGLENSDEKSSEEVPSNLNIMNPLFGRLSMLPSMVKEVVDNALSPSHETQDRITIEGESDKKIDEKESKTDSDLDKIPEIPSAESTTTPKFNDQISLGNIVNVVDNNNYFENEKINNESTADNIDTTRNVVIDNSTQPGIYKQDELSGFGQDKLAVDETSSFNGFPANRNLLNVGSGLQPDDHKSAADSSEILHTENSFDYKEGKKENKVDEQLPNEDFPKIVNAPNDISETEQHIATETIDSCLVDSTCQKPEGLDENHSFVREVAGDPTEEEVGILDVISIRRNYWETLTYLVVTAITTLLFSLGYYYIENTRRDSQYIAKINKLEKQLLVCSKECTQLDDTLKSTKTKLDSIEDESFGSNEMVASLKADLEASKAAKSELEDQVAILEKELESATEAGLELERMLREILATKNEDNPLAQSVEDLQTRLNAQQAANEALTNALNLKAQENETLAAELKASCVKSEQLEVEVTRLTEELKHQLNLKSNLEHALLEKVESLEKQVKDITAERINLRQQLKGKEMELKDLLEVVNHMNINNLDFDKLYNVSKVKAEASQLLEERDDLKMRLTEVEGAHHLLEEHVKLINEEVASLSEQCKLAEKAKRDAETRVEVLSNFFKEKDAQRQKQEAVWLEKQGEVSSTVERLHAMQNEIQNYKQQIEMLKREILDQEREYKNQISTLETKSHENWVLARQNERRLEESKAEAGQLRNRLTLIEKNLNDADPEAKLHRLEANGETPTSPQLYMGAEASSSPIMFSASSGVPLPPPPSYLYGPPVPPFMPPPPHSSSGMTSYDVGQRPPPLGGRLSSPPPLPPVNSGRYDNPRSPPPPIQSYGAHRAFPPFGNERIHPPPLPPHSSHLPPPLPPLGDSGSHSWPEEAIPPPPLRNSGFQPHQQQSQHHHHHHPPPPHHHHRDNQQRSRNHKGSLHSSGESLDKNL